MNNLNLKKELQEQKVFIFISYLPPTTLFPT